MGRGVAWIETDRLFVVLLGRGILFQPHIYGALYDVNFRVFVVYLFSRFDLLERLGEIAPPGRSDRERLLVLERLRLVGFNVRFLAPAPAGHEHYDNDESRLQGVIHFNRASRAE